MSDKHRYAHVCSRMLTYAHVCSRMLTYAPMSDKKSNHPDLADIDLTYARVCYRMLTYAHVCSVHHPSGKQSIRPHLADTDLSSRLVYEYTSGPPQAQGCPPVSAQEQSEIDLDLSSRLDGAALSAPRSRMLTYAHVCSRMLTYAHVCSRMLACSGIRCASILVKCWTECL
jgi:hypothetical protein